MDEAISYAENDLSVHKIFQRTEELVDEIDALYETVEGYRAQEKQHDAELDLLLTMQTVGADDKEERYHRSRLEHLSSQIETTLHDILVREMRVKVNTARMVQLGGYFNYLAAASQANTVD